VVVYWECANITANNLDLSTPWYCVSCKQDRLIKEQEETILSAEEVGFGSQSTASLEADNGWSSERNCLLFGQRL
jgi:hypothetical protein